MTSDHKTIFRVRLALATLGVFLALTLLATPKPWESDPPSRIGDFVRIYSWWGGLINFGALALLFPTVPLWTPRFEIPADSRFKFKNPRGFVPAVLAAMVVGAALGGARLPHSLWSDEIYSMQRCVMGTHRVKDDGTVKFRRTPWLETFWFYTKPTNHVFQSILSRLSLNTWQMVAKPAGLQINEMAVRFPSYVAGVFALGAGALLLARVGFPWEGALAAWLLAIHPWHMRFTSEARAYGLVMLLIPLCCLFALRALESGRWRWWIALAAVEFALLYSWVPAFAVVAILNLGLLYRLLTGQQFAAARSTVIARWLVCQAVAAMVFLQLFLPCVPQLFAYVKDTWDFPSHPFWLKNVGALFLTGSLWSKSGRLDSPYLEYLPHAHAHPLAFALAAGLFGIFLLLGIIRFWRSGTTPRLLLAVFLLPGPLMYAMAALQHKYLFEWYIGFMLPGTIMLVAVGALWFPSLISARRGIPRAKLWAAVLLIAAFGLLSQPARKLLLTRSVQADRESVLLTRPNLDPTTPENRNILTAGTSAVPDLYDPLVRRLRTLDDYAAIMREADERGVPLYVNNGFLAVLKTEHPDIQALLEDPALFEHVRTFFAIEFILDREVRKYRPGSIEGVELSRYRKQPVQPPGSAGDT